MGYVGQQGAQRDERRRSQAGEVTQHLVAEGFPAQVGLDARDQDDVAVLGSGVAVPETGTAPRQFALALGRETDIRAVHLEVVIVLRVESGNPGATPSHEEVGDRVACGFSGVVPALEGRDHDGVAQLAVDVDFDHAQKPTASLPYRGPLRRSEPAVSGLRRGDTGRYADAR